MSAHSTVQLAVTPHVPARPTSTPTTPRRAGLALAVGLVLSVHGFAQLEPTGHWTGTYDYDGIGNTVALVRVVSGADPAVVLHESMNAANSGYGRQLAGGDVNRDGRGDLLVGDPWVNIDGVVDIGAVTLFTSTCVASWTSVGTGLAGTIGTPRLKPDLGTAPVLGQVFDVNVSNTAGVPTSSWLLAGLAELSLPFKGGVLHTDPLVIVGVPLPTDTSVIPLALPDDETLCHVVLTTQLVVQDAGAPVGFALSPGLRMVLGY